MPSFFMRLRKVLGFIPRIVAAPPGPFDHAFRASQHVDDVQALDVIE